MRLDNISPGTNAVQGMSQKNILSSGGLYFSKTIKYLSELIVSQSTKL